MHDAPKRIKRLVREHVGLAYEEELRRALVPLAEAFDKWKAGILSSGELSDLIHEFHQSPSRNLFAMYNSGSREWNVAHAIVAGILDRQQVPAELLDHLNREIGFCEEQAKGEGVI